MVVVVGGGIVGLSVAWYVRAAGHRVIVLEAGSPGAERCSLGNAGLIVPSHIVPLAAPGATRIALRALFDRRSPLRIKPRLDAAFLAWCWRFWRSATSAHVAQSAPALRDIALLSRLCHEELSREWGGTFGLRTHGLRVLCSTRHGLEEEAHAARFAQSLGVPAAVLDAVDTARSEPELEMSAVGSVFYPLDAHLVPLDLFASLAGRLAARDGIVHWSMPVTGWRVDQGRIRAVCTRAGEIEGDEFVLAAGVWSEQLARRIGVRIPLEAGKGYSVTVDAAGTLPRSSLILSEARVAVTPVGRALRFAGTLELAGLDAGIDARRLAAMLESVQRYLPAFGAQRLRTASAWAGLRPCSPDGLPYIGRTRRFPNLSICTGHAMMGVSLAPASGRLIGELIDGRLPSLPLGAFDPDRFA